MNSGEEKKPEQKFERLHQLALAMYRNKDFSAALKIWRRLKERNPDFPDIDKWIDYASRAIQPETRSKPKTDPSVFRTQRELMSEYGTSARKRQFRPKPSSVPMKRRLRHRNVVYISLIFLLLYTLLSFRNNRTYMVKLNVVSYNLDCFQGLFFPVGWERTMELEIGIDSNWTDIFTDQKLIKKLSKGITVHSLKSFDDLIIEVFMDLGNEALRKMTVRSQQSAIFYFKKVESAHFKDLVSTKIALAFIHLSNMSADSGDFDEAGEYYREARKYDHTHPDLFKLSDRLGSSGR